MASQYRWHLLPGGRSVYRKVAGQAAPKRASFPCPMILKDAIEPVQSMADGKTYDSMSALRKTYRADGNPQGVEYQEVGDEQRPERPETPGVTKEECAVLLDQFEAAVSRGEVAEVT